MDEKVFEDLLQSVRDLGRHRRGENVAGVGATEVVEPEARTIREATKLSQNEFVRLVGVPVKTLQNWEQKRTRPAGPARALRRATAKGPGNVLQALSGG